MRRLRRVLAPIVIAWIMFHAATLVLAAAAFGVGAMSVALLECTCAHGTDHTDCPMHHPAAPSRPGLNQVQCAGAADSALLGVLLGHVGLPQAPTRALPFNAQRASVLVDVTTRILRPAPPDPPPPRA